MRLSLLLFIAQILASRAYPEITKYLLEEALECQKDTSIEVIGFQVKNATKKGENNFSALYRVDVQYYQNESTTVSNTSVIAKVQIMDDEKLRNVTGLVFPKEVSMYDKTLKAMNAALPDKHRLSPEILFAQTQEPMIIVMEDLALSGYTMKKCRNDFDLEHSLLAMDVIARFHASSVCVHGKDLATEFPTIISGNTSDTTLALAMKEFAAEISTWPGIAPEFVEKVRNISDRVLPIIINTTKYKEQKFNVLNHGDFYGNNVMFKHNSRNQPIDAILIDFQLCKFNSPALDLVVFMCLSISDEVYFNHKDQLVQRYYTTLKSTMERMPCKTEVLSLEELHRQLADFAIVEMCYTMLTLAHFMHNQKCAGQRKFVNPTAGKNESAVYTDEYREILTKRLPLYDEMGLLDL